MVLLVDAESDALRAARAIVALGWVVADDAWPFPAPCCGVSEGRYEQPHELRAQLSNPSLYQKGEQGFGKRFIDGEPEGALRPLISVQLILEA